MTIQELGALVKKRRIELGITRYELMKKKVIAYTPLLRLEEGDGKDVRFSILNRLLQYLKLDMQIVELDVEQNDEESLQD